MSVEAGFDIVVEGEDTQEGVGGGYKYALDHPADGKPADGKG